MKKVSFLTVLLIMLVCAGAYAENIYYQSFESASVGSWISGYTYPKGHTIGVLEENGNRFGAIQVNMSNSQGSPYSDILLKKVVCDRIIFECSVKTKNNNGLASCYMFLYDENHKYFVPVKIIGNSLYTDNGKTIIARLKENTFVDVMVDMNMVERKYDVYADGALAAEGLSLGSFTGTYIERLRPCVQEFKTGCSDLLFGFDNIIVKNLPGDVYFYPRAKKCRSDIGYIDMKNEAEYKNNTLYLPALAAAKAIGAGADGDEDIVQITADGESSTFTADSNVIKKDNAQLATSYPPYTKNGALYVCAADLAAACKMQCKADKTGAAVIGVTADSFSWDKVWNYYYENTLTNNPLKSEMLSSIENMLLEYPSANKISSDIKKINAGHPRVLADKNTFDLIRANYGTDAELKKACDFVTACADAWCSTSVRTVARYGSSDGIRMLSPIYDCGNTVIACCFAWQLTGKEKYAARAWTEISNFCDESKWSDWNEYHMIDVGEAMYNCAIAYDWLYDWLSDEQRSIISDAVIKRAWKPYWDDANDLTVSSTSSVRENIPYKSESEKLIRSTLWRKLGRKNNWSFIIYGGAVMSACAMFDEYPDESAAIIENAVSESVGAFEGFAPDGAWFEGMSYWGYSVEFITNMLSTLQNSCGTDYGLGNMPGLSTTGNYLFDMNGSDGSFNFSDSDAEFTASAEVFWLAGKYNDNLLYTLISDFYKSRNIPIGKDELTSVQSENAASVTKAALWYAGCSFVQETNTSHDSIYRDVETASLRSGYGDDANYIAIHGGKNDDPHSHVDSGTFVLDYQGARFAMDLGKDNYNISGGNYRYRYNLQGHNCVIFDPETPEEAKITTNNFSGGQVRWNNAKIIDFKSGKGEAYAVCDLTNSYPNVSSYKRGIMLTNNRQSFIIRDEFTLKQAAKNVYWFMHTDAAISLSNDKRTATLTKNGKTLSFKILSAGGVFDILDPVGLEGSAVAQYDNQPGAYSNEGIKKLSIHFTNLEKGTHCISVGAAGGSGYTFGNSPIADWSVEPSEDEPLLTGIYINGKLLPEFNNNVTSYSINVDALPDITASGTGDIDIYIPERLNEDAYVVIANSSEIKAYKIHLGSPHKMPDASFVSAFGIAGEENRFINRETDELILDLGHLTDIAAVAAGISEVTDLKMSVSEDNESYSTVYSGKAGTGNMIYCDKPNSLRYLKIECGDINAVNDVSIQSENGRQYELLFAFYDDNGVLTSIDKKTITGIIGMKNELSFAAKENESVLKVYLWKEGKLHPLQEAAKLSK